MTLGFRLFKIFVCYSTNDKIVPDRANGGSGFVKII